MRRGRPRRLVGWVAAGPPSPGGAARRVTRCSWAEARPLVVPSMRAQEAVSHSSGWGLRANAAHAPSDHCGSDGRFTHKGSIAGAVRTSSGGQHQGSRTLVCIVPPPPQ